MVTKLRHVSRAPVSCEERVTVLFSMQIVAYLFLGGTAGGMLLITCLASLLGARRPASERERVARAGLHTRCVLAGLVALAAATMCLVGGLLLRYCVVFCGTH